MAHADIDPANPPRRRIGAVVLVLDEADRVLLVNPTYKEGWQLPGGGAAAGEPAAKAASRELLEETGLDLWLSQILVVDYVPANEEGTSAEGYNLVFNGGSLTAEEARKVAIPESASKELSGLKWVPVPDLENFVQPYQARRIRAAVANLETKRQQDFLELGEAVAA
ncbi:NUDIX domain-containing protein [Streptomyces roseifaciens]